MTTDISHSVAEALERVIDQKASSGQGSAKTLTGTVVRVDKDGRAWVHIHGGVTETPTVERTVAVSPGDTVRVRIENNKAVIEGNLSDISAGQKSVSDQIEVVERKQTERFDKIVAAEAEISNLVAQKASIDELHSNYITAEQIEATYATVHQLETDYLSADEIEAGYASIDRMNAAEAYISDLDAGRITAENLEAWAAKVTLFTADSAVITDIRAALAKLGQFDASYGKIDWGSLTTAEIQKLFADDGIFHEVTSHDGTFTGTVAGVKVNASTATANTVVADTLILKAPDGTYREISVNELGEAVVSVDPVTNVETLILGEEAVITTITVDDLKAATALVGGFHISEGTIHSVLKPDVDTGSGVYLNSKTNEVGIGDTVSYIKYYDSDDDGVADKIDISANSISLAAKGVVTTEADIANPNLFPFFQVHPYDTRFWKTDSSTPSISPVYPAVAVGYSTSYWRDAEFQQLEDGWLHYDFYGRTDSEYAASVYNGAGVYLIRVDDPGYDFWVAAGLEHEVEVEEEIPGTDPPETQTVTQKTVEGSTVTLLIEVRNLLVESSLSEPEQSENESSTEVSEDPPTIHFRFTNNANMQLVWSETGEVTVTNGRHYFSATLRSDTAKSSLGLYPRVYVQANLNASFDIRIGLFAGDYNGGWKPYTGELLYDQAKWSDANNVHGFFSKASDDSTYWNSLTNFLVGYPQTNNGWLEFDTFSPWMVDNPPAQTSIFANAIPKLGDLLATVPENTPFTVLFEFMDVDWADITNSTSSYMFINGGTATGIRPFTATPDHVGKAMPVSENMNVVHFANRTGQTSFEKRIFMYKTDRVDPDVKLATYVRIYFYHDYRVTGKVRVSLYPGIYTGPYKTPTENVLFTDIYQTAADLGSTTQRVESRVTDAEAAIQTKASVEEVQNLAASLTLQEGEIELMAGDLNAVTTRVLIDENGMSIRNSASSGHLDLSNDELAFVGPDGSKAAYIAIDPNTNQSVLYVVRTLVLQDMTFGEGKWKWWKRDNDNMALKWMG